MAQLGYLGPYNIDRLRPFATRGTRLGGVDELLAQRSAETINKLGLPTTQREDGTMSGPAVIYDGFRTPQDQANAIRSVARRNRIPWNDSLLRTGIPGMAAPVGRSQHERGRAVDVLEPYVAAFRDNLAPDMRQPLPGSDANHFELVKQAQNVGAAPAGQGDAMAASGNDTMAAIPGATQPTQAYGGMTPEQADWNRKFGAQLMQMGTSAAPVGHWTQALARVLQGGMGGYMMGAGNRGMAEGQAAGNQALAAALANPSVTPAQYAQTALGNPFTAPQGQQMAQAVMAQRAKPQDPLLNERRNLMQAQAQAAQARADQVRNPQSTDQRALTVQYFENPNTGRLEPFQLRNNAPPVPLLGEIAQAVTRTNPPIPGVNAPDKTGAAPPNQMQAPGQTPENRPLPREIANQVPLLTGPRNPFEGLNPKARMAAETEDAKAFAKNIAKVRSTLPQRARTIAGRNLTYRVVNDAISRAYKNIGALTTGAPGQLLQNIGGTDAMNLRELLGTIRANIGFDKLQEMRDSSPTGGALGQVTEKELGFLQAVYGSLAQAQTVGQLKQNLDIVKGVMQAQRDIAKEAFEIDQKIARGERVDYGNLLIRQEALINKALGALTEGGGSPAGNTPPARSGTYNWTPDGGLQEAR